MRPGLKHGHEISIGDKQQVHCQPSHEPSAFFRWTITVTLSIAEQAKVTVTRLVQSKPRLFVWFYF
jgi:hypothetical protein